MFRRGPQGRARRVRRAVVTVALAVVVQAVALGSAPSGAAPEDGPGGPILLLTSAANPFSTYYAEILRNEGLNLFDTADLGSVTAGDLAAHDVVLLGEVPVDAAQATMLAAWVEDGGNLVTMRPDAELAGLAGLTDTGADLSDAYLGIDTTAGTPGAGLVAETIQFHGTADRYQLDAGTEALATLHTDASTATDAPAVALRSVGTQGGQVATFTYDLARSVVQTRQGNPAWAGQERDGQQPPILRADDMFFPDWVDLDRVQIPQADEQQRLLANIIEHVNRDVMPLPRFWYLPRGERAAVVMTGDDHGGGGTAAQFDWDIAASPEGCDVEDWECVRGTSYLFPGAPITDAEAAAYEAQGFEVGLHVDTGCADWTPAALEAFYADQVADAVAARPSIAAPSTTRTHCITWSDWASQPEVQATHGIRLDTNYYYWPGSWVQDRPGHFTGSGLPMRFADLDGSLIDVYQAPTQMTDESGIGYAHHISTLLDNALGPEGFYGVVTTNMHTDTGPHPGQQAVVAAALARGVPVVSARQMLTWLDGRNGSSFDDLAWDGDELTFSLTAAEGANGLQALLPTQGPEGTLTSLTLDGQPVAVETQVIKGIQYAAFPAAEGGYAATYAADETAPAISGVEVTPSSGDTAMVTWTTDEPATSGVLLGSGPDDLAPVADDASLTTAHEVELTGLAPSTTYHLRVTSTDGAGNAATSPDPPATLTFETPGTTVVDTSVADFGAGSTTGTYVADTSGGEVILAPTAATELGGTSLPAGWSTGTWSGGSTVLAGGRASVDGSWMRSDDPVGAGRAVEFSATFSGDAFQNAGLGDELDGNGESWALFGTNATSGVLRARTLDAGGSPVDVVLGSQYVGSEHRFRIEWDTTVRFYVDGALVHTAPTVGGTMRPVASDYATGGGALSVDWVRMSPHATAGTFLSRVHDAGAPADWGTLVADTSAPGGTTLALSVRTGPTPTPDGDWTAFAPLASGDDVATSGRHLQYRVEATSVDGSATPTLSSVAISFTSGADTTAPTITDQVPAPGATGVDVGSDVTATFDEHVVPEGDWASAMTLRAGGSDTDVPATVTYAAPSATLDPTVALEPATEYTVTVDGSVADASGNPLGEPVTWTFTTGLGTGSVGDDIAADFAAGSPGDDTSVVVTDDGEVILTPTAGAEHEGTGLGAGWTSTLWSGGPGGSTLGDGDVVVDGALLTTDDLHAPGRSLEAVATFGAASFQHVGLGVDVNEVPTWALFSTGSSGGSVLYARTNAGGVVADVPLAGGLVGSPHRYRIDWSESAVVFSVDGVVVHTQAVAIPDAMRPLVSDFGAGGAGVTVDWLRLSPYAAAGTFTSRVFDAGTAVDWGDLAATADTPAGTSIALEVRTGDTATPDGTWSPFTPVDPGEDVPGTSRHLQYRAVLSTGDPAVTPSLADVSVAFVVPAVLPVVTGGAGVVTEGDAGSVTVEVPVRLSAPSGATVTVDWATTTPTQPEPGVDFDAASGTVTFAPGDTEETITITVHGDTLDEPGQLWGAEWLGIELTSPTNATFGTGLFARYGLALIVDDDPPPVVAGGLAAVVEGDAGSVTVEVPVRLSAPSGATVTVDWATTTPTQPEPGVDFDAASGTVTFAPGDTEETITITVHGDTLDEPGQLWGAEWLGIELTSPTNATFGTGLFARYGLALIVDDD